MKCVVDGHTHHLPIENRCDALRQFSTAIIAHMRDAIELALWLMSTDAAGHREVLWTKSNPVLASFRFFSLLAIS